MGLISFKDDLSIYLQHNYFYFNRSDSLTTVCNAPTDKAGIYLVYAVYNNVEELIYIGCSGLRQSDGTIKIRKAELGGMKDRIVNGHQFGKIARKRSWKTKMQEEKTEKLHVYWWVTYTAKLQHFPKDVETILLNYYYEKFNKLPRWNKMI